MVSSADIILSSTDLSKPIQLYNDGVGFFAEKTFEWVKFLQVNPKDSMMKTAAKICVSFIAAITLVIPIFLLLASAKHYYEAKLAELDPQSTRGDRECIERILDGAEKYPFTPHKLGYQAMELVGGKCVGVDAKSCYGLPHFQPYSDNGRKEIGRIIGELEKTYSVHSPQKSILPCDYLAHFGRLKGFYTFNGEYDEATHSTISEDVIKSSFDGERPCVFLPEGLSVEQYDKLRREYQKAVQEYAKSLQNPEFMKSCRETTAYSLAGVVLTAPCRMCVERIVDVGNGEKKPFVYPMLASGLNLSNRGVFQVSYVKSKMNKYYEKTMSSLLESAHKKDLDALVLNLAIGAGEFSGEWKTEVKAANVDGLCKALDEKKKAGLPSIVVPDCGFTKEQEKRLKDRGVHICKADKDAITALLAQSGLKVGVLIASDPEVMLGRALPGYLFHIKVFCASDEERAPFLYENLQFLSLACPSVVTDGGKETRISSLLLFPEAANKG